ncbi:MAG: hypothetical protein IT372_15435 [Polyangiaceae bacterium]|nr:hypothetical protein [Polyangiaceae bacterium]
MFRYLLDSNVVITFQRANRLAELAAAAATVGLAIVDDVEEELTHPPRPADPVTAKMKDVARVIAGSSIEVIPIIAGSPEDWGREALKRLVGAGEAASVAVAVRRSDLIFVTEDIRAVEGEKLRLYRELPGEAGRIIGIHSLLRILVERSAITAQVATNVSDAGGRSNGPPLWWADWAAALS